MNRFRKLMLSILTACIVLQAGSLRALAADKYTYVVTIYAGDKGSLTGAGVEVSSSSGSARVSVEGSKITITGLELGDRVGLQAASGGAVALNDGGKYYVKGIRKSGYDNNTVSAASFEVTGDEDYVVAYGIRGDMAAYTVNYQDADGNALAASQTYYGNVGDKPVVAFLYVEGYVPEAYNLMKTLVSDESQNVFTFVYRPVPAAAAETTAPAETPAANEGTGTGTGGEVGAPEGAAAENPGAGGAEDAENAENAESTEPLQEMPDDEVPRDLVDLDDEQTPLANADISDSNTAEGGSVVLRNSLIGTGFAAVLAIALFLFLKKKKKDSTEENMEE